MALDKKTITLWLRLIMIPIAVISVVVFPPWHGVWAWLKPLPDTVQEQVEDAVSHGLDGIIVYVDKGGEDPEFYAAGWKDRDAKIPADPEALFKIASIRKLYVAAAVAKMVGAGTLDLDHTVADHFPELIGRIEYADTITLRQMLAHRSGIPNYVDQEGYRWDAPPRSREEALELVLDLPADFEPDTSYAYSNTNFLLLGKLMDDTLGYPHERYITDEILVPLGLTHTFHSLDEVDLEDVMSGYYVGEDVDFKPLDFGMLATAEDVGTFVRALNDGSLFSEKEQDIYSSIYVYEHKGWVLGYQSAARYDRDLDTVVVQFVNTVSDETELTTLVVFNRIWEILGKEGG